MPTYDSPGPVVAEVEISVGQVDVTASDRADTAVEVLPSRPGRAGDVSLAREATVLFEDGRLRVHVPRRLNLFSQSDSVDVRIGLPTGSHLVVETAYGALRARGVLGVTRVDAKHGSARLEQVGDLVLSSAHGEVEVAEVGGRLDAVVGHGSLRVGRVVGETRIRGSYGDISLGTTEAPVDVSTSGELTVDRALADLTARSAHGDIRVLEARAGRLRLENHHADVEVGIPEGVAAWVDAVSTNGVVRNDLTPGPEPVTPGNHVELHLRTDYADVRIHRATFRRPG